MSQMKEQDKYPEKQLNEMKIGTLPKKKKRIQKNDSEGDPGSQKKNREDARNVYQRSWRTKGETEMKNTLEGIIVAGVYSG